MEFGRKKITKQIGHKLKESLKKTILKKINYDTFVLTNKWMIRRGWNYTYLESKQGKSIKISEQWNNITTVVFLKDYLAVIQHTQLRGIRK